MLVYKGENCGFCFGVNRAVKNAEKLNGDNCYILGDIIHNESVVNKIKNSGVKIINSLSDVDFKVGDTLLIRSHGEPESVFVKAKEMGITVVDCTCPFVKKIHDIVKKHYNLGYKIVIIGDANHPEVVGINPRRLSPYGLRHSAEGKRGLHVSVGPVLRRSHSRGV